MIGHDGMELFHTLAQSEPRLQISATEALLHSYFQGMKSGSETQVIPFEYSPNSLPTHQKFRYNCLYINTEHRAGIVDWLFEIVTVFNMKTRTVYLAMEYLDKYLRSTTNDHIERLQLIAATCLYIASKSNNDVNLTISDLPFCADRIYEVDDILLLEDTILNGIEWEVTIPTLYDCVTFYLERMKIKGGSKDFWLSLFISEFALQTNLCHHSLCVIAATIITISLYSTGSWNGWSNQMEHIFQNDLDSIIACYEDIQAWLSSKDNHPFLEIIDRRYSNHSRMCVASTNLVLLPAPLMREKLIQSL